MKACIAKLTNLHNFPNKDRVNKAHTHDIEILVNVAGVLADRDAANDADPALKLNWRIVKAWREVARYQLWTEDDARELAAAVSDPAHGVLPWIMARW